MTPATPTLPEASRRAKARIAVVGLCGLAVAAAALAAARGVEPVHTWAYPLLWYPTLVALDVATAPRAGGLFWLDRPRFALGLFGWSVVGWCLFELLNFRIANWYYVFVPAARAERWLGIVVSFATVFPALWLGERVLRALGPAHGSRTRPLFKVTPRLLRGCVALGLAFLTLAFAWPGAFYPATWGAVTLLLEPWNYARDPSRSLIGDLERGDPGRIARLVGGGLVIGLLWEAYNATAAGRWIYTVPGLEEWTLFEMPLLGYFGFSVFALDAFVMVQSLVLAGLLPAPERDPAVRTRLDARRVTVGALAGTLFVAGVLLGIDRFTTSSHEPEIASYGVLPSDARRALAGVALSDLARANPSELAAAVPGADAAAANAWVAAAELAMLRGIGTANAEALWRAGVRSVSDLARAEPRELYRRLVSDAATPRLREAQVRIWVRAARRAAGS